ncbi:MAG: histidinol-phosphate transaminase [Gammaproteobacteria bacterium]|nr:MAG: histidinol-phosphate transaminase [Gammaproteobacteria bacterium]
MKIQATGIMLMAETLTKWTSSSMSKSIELARPEIRKLVPYSAASYEEGLVRLNANETPWPAPGGSTAASLNNYPPEKPVELTNRLAEYYGVAPENLLVTRGSSEAIDLLIRCFCAAGEDAVVICPPTFGMYRVYADIQGARVHEIPLEAEHNYALNADEITRNWPDDGKLLFICSPNNPTGNSFATEQINLLATLLSGRAIVVVDAAYAEFADETQTKDLLESMDNDNIVILRTLSKAFGLAGARCGGLIGPANIISMASCVMPPYAIATPVLDAALASLTPDAKMQVAEHCEILRNERDRLAAELAQLDGIETVYPSEANFLLVKAKDADRCMHLAQEGGVLIRNLGGQLPGSLRITVGNAEQNNLLLQSLAKL